MTLVSPELIQEHWFASLSFLIRSRHFPSPFRAFDRAVPVTSLTTPNTVVSENLDHVRPTRVLLWSGDREIRERMRESLGGENVLSLDRRRGTDGLRFELLWRELGWIKYLC